MKLNRKLAIGGVVLAAFGAAGGAYAVTNSGGNGRDAYLNDLATRLHVSRDQLDSALKGAFEDRIDAAVKAGKLTQSEADNIKKKVEQSGVVPGLGGPPVGGPRPFLGKGPGPGGPGFGLGIRAAATDVAKYLGLTQAQLRQQVASGKSLADIAKAQNKPLDGLKNEIKAAATKQLDQAVKDKKITQEQANNLLDKLTAHLDDLVNATPGQFKRHMFRKGHFGPQSAPAPPPGAGKFF
jgi:polyhydroxyalkanoate synthesis regulator phasin